MKKKFKKLSWEEFFERCKPTRSSYRFYHQYSKNNNGEWTGLFKKTDIETNFDNLEICYKNYLESKNIY